MWTTIRAGWTAVGSRTDVRVVSAAVGVLYFIADGILLPRELASGWSEEATSWIVVIYGILLIACLLATIVCLARRRFWRAWRYFTAFAIAWLSGQAAHLLAKTLDDEQHAQIAAIYRQSRNGLIDSALAGQSSAGRLVPLGDRCHPSIWCTCWIVLDPGHASGVEADLGDWHSPRSSFFPNDIPPFASSRIDVRRIDADTFSVLACLAYPGLG
jgi:hypothetical protein